MLGSSASLVDENDIGGIVVGAVEAFSRSVGCIARASDGELVMENCHGLIELNESGRTSQR